MATIKGKIIRILDENSVIINLGKKDGILDGAEFKIMGEAESIIDPFSNEELGKVVLVKERLTASTTFDKFTIARKPALIDISQINFLRSQNVSLNVDTDQIEPWKATSEEPIKIGDEVETQVQDNKSNEETEEESDK